MTTHSAQYLGARLPRSVGAALAAFGAVFSIQSAALADVIVGGGLDWVLPSDRSVAKNGAGFNVRVGERLDGKIVVLTGELMGSYAKLSSPGSPTALIGAAGGRLGLGLGLRPSIFAHLGVANLDFARGYSGEKSDATGLAYDMGASLEFTLLPLLDMGAELAYVDVASLGERRFGWVRAGLTATLVF